MTKPPRPAPPRPPLRACAAVILAGLLSFAFAACGLFDDPAESLAPTPTPDPAGVSLNLLANPGFEQGETAWTYRDAVEWRPFAISDAVAYRQQHSLELRLESTDADTGTRIVGAVQELRPLELPEYLSGWYRVDEWTPSATHQYVQFVVAVYGADYEDEFDIHEVRFPIVGIESDPFTLTNARWRYLSRDTTPELGEWTYFGYPVRAAFEEAWGRVPGRFDRIDVFFEVRYDNKQPGQGASTATVYFDDVYLGLFATNPNRPSFIE
jgi:hypothetical protein